MPKLDSFVKFSLDSLRVEGKECYIPQIKEGNSLYDIKVLYKYRKGKRYIKKKEYCWMITTDLFEELDEEDYIYGYNFLVDNNYL